MGREDKGRDVRSPSVKEFGVKKGNGSFVYLMQNKNKDHQKQNNKL